MRPAKPTEVLLERAQFEARKKDGGGILSFEAWGYARGGRTVVTRYNIAYIDLLLYRGDNGRVLGYDNAHGEHHRHFMGASEAVKFEGYERLVARFQAEWRMLAKPARRR